MTAAPAAARRLQTCSARRSGRCAVLEPDDDDAKKPEAAAPSPARLAAQLAAKHAAAATRLKLDELFQYDGGRFDLSGQELARLAAGRRPTLGVLDDEIQLTLHADAWGETEFMWDGLSDVLNDWACGRRVRDGLPAAIEAAAALGAPTTVLPLGIHGMWMQPMPTYPDF